MTEQNEGRLGRARELALQVRDLRMGEKSGEELYAEAEKLKEHARDAGAYHEGMAKVIPNDAARHVAISEGYKVIQRDLADVQSR